MGQPQLGYSQNYQGYNYNNNSYPQQQSDTRYGPRPPVADASSATYGPQYGPHYGAQAGLASYDASASAAPVIRNPFPTDDQQQQYYGGTAGRGSSYSQGSNNNYNNRWQADNSAGTSGGQSYGSSYGQTYSSDASSGQYGATGGGQSHTDATSATAGATYGGHAEDGQKERNKTVYRSGGGKTWADDTLLEWDPSHLRLFVGNLAGEVTDDTLLKAFSRWKSVQKAAVKRDKWTKKSRGFGFVSFSDADDFFQAAKEMNGKYIGSHPVVVRKSKTEIKVSAFKDESGGNSNGGHGKNRKKNGGGGGNNSNTASYDYASGTSTPLGAAAGVTGALAGGAAAKKSAGSGSGAHGKRGDAYEPGHGPVSTAVHKSSKNNKNKTKNGLKLLG